MRNVYAVEVAEASSLSIMCVLISFERVNRRVFLGILVRQGNEDAPPQDAYDTFSTGLSSSMTTAAPERYGADART